MKKGIEGRYRIVGVKPGVIVSHKHGTIDLRTLTLAKADELYKAGFRYLEKIELPQAEAKSKK